MLSLPHVIKDVNIGFFVFGHGVFLSLYMSFKNRHLHISLEGCLGYLLRVTWVQARASSCALSCWTKWNISTGNKQLLRLNKFVV